jgi:uncharacterized membrane protein
MSFYNIPIFDWLALVLLILVWSAYTWFADFSRWSKNSLPKVMNVHRGRWMRDMLRRDLRMPDVIVMGHFVHSAVFFASTAILIIGGLVTSLGSSEKAMEAITALPFVSSTSQGLWELKIVALICAFICAFVKFIWAMRLANYSCVLFNALPFESRDISDQYAIELGKMTGLFAQHFNQGLRANFFALALLGWWLNTWFFIASIAIVLWVIYRREFRSQSLIIANKLMLLTDPQVESDIQMQQKAKLTDVNAAGETKNLNLSTT